MSSHTAQYQNYGILKYDAVLFDNHACPPNYTVSYSRRPSYFSDFQTHSFLDKYNAHSVHLFRHVSVCQTIRVITNSFLKAKNVSCYTKQKYP
jgi:hypothetical protein